MICGTLQAGRGTDGETWIAMIADKGRLLSYSVTRYTAFYGQRRHDMAPVPGIDVVHLAYNKFSVGMRSFMRILYIRHILIIAYFTLLAQDSIASQGLFG